MIYAELRNLVSRIRADNTVDILDSAKDLFDKMGHDSYMDVFEATIGSTQGSSDNDIIDNLLLDVHAILNQLFSMQGVAVVDDILLSDKIAIASALVDVFEYEDRQAIITILNADMTPEEKISDVLALVCVLNSEEIFTYIQEVNPNIIGRMLDVLGPPAQEVVDLEDAVQQKRIIDAYVQYKQGVLNGQPHITDIYLINPQSIGLPYLMYLDNILKSSTTKSLLTELDKYDQVVRAINTNHEKLTSILLGIAILSGENDMNFSKTITENLSAVSGNANTMKNITACINDLLIKMNRTDQ